MIDDRRKLRRIDPASVGSALLTAADEESLLWLTESDWEWYMPVRDESIIALPSEVAFPRTGNRGVLYPLPDPARELVPWERAREEFGGLLVYDSRSPMRVSVLCTSEPLDLWKWQLASFPPGSRKAATPELDEALRQLQRDHPDEQEDALRAELAESLIKHMLALKGCEVHPLPGPQYWMAPDGRTLSQVARAVDEDLAEEA